MKLNSNCLCYCVILTITICPNRQSLFLHQSPYTHNHLTKYNENANKKEEHMNAEKTTDQ